MKKLTAILFFLMCTTFAYSQYRGYDEWIASVGINIVDNSALKNPFEGAEDLSFSTPITFGIEYKFDENWAINPMFSFNEIDRFYVDYKHAKDTGLPQGWIEKNGSYFSFDVNGKFYYDEYIVRDNRLDAYVAFGFGFYEVSKESNISGNFGLGIRYWITKEFGVRVQTLAKFAFDSDQIYANNNLIHSLELLYRF